MSSEKLSDLRHRSFNPLTGVTRRSILSPWSAALSVDAAPEVEWAMAQTYRTLRVAPSGEGVLSVVIDATPMNLIGPELVRQPCSRRGCRPAARSNSTSATASNPCDS